MYCRHCGKSIEDDSRFCRYCGGSVQFVGHNAVNSYKKNVSLSERPETQPPKKDKLSFEEGEFEEIPVEAYRKIILSPEARRREMLKKKAREKNEKLNRLFRTAVLKHVLAKKHENELDKLGAKNIDLYKRNMKGK